MASFFVGGFTASTLALWWFHREVGWGMLVKISILWTITYYLLALGAGLVLLQWFDPAHRGG